MLTAALGCSSPRRKEKEVQQTAPAIIIVNISCMSVGGGGGTISMLNARAFRAKSGLSR